MAGRAHVLHYSFAAARAGGAAACTAELDAADRLDARRDRLGRERVGIGAALARHELHEEHDGEDRNDERRGHDEDQLLRRLDERGVLVVRVDDRSYCGWKGVILGEKLAILCVAEAAVVQVT